MGQEKCSVNVKPFRRGCLYLRKTIKIDLLGQKNEKLRFDFLACAITSSIAAAWEFDALSGR